MSRFDHIEVHVKDIQKYCLFLTKIFEGGSYEVISKTGTSMFTSPDGINIEVKKRSIDHEPLASGFCNPALRRLGAKEFILGLGFNIEKELEASFGMVYFFKDDEGITWHIKNIQE
jgi:hypothetical protein